MIALARAAALAALAAACLVGADAQPGPAPETGVGSRDGLYGEKHRPRLHFTPPSMWMNDPNGLVYFAGEYHLYYQYYPKDIVWGPMHWGHAVSRDLVRWEHLPIALEPDGHGYIFSGSAVVDWQNTSGFGKDGEPPLVAVFTYHDPERGKAGTNDHETQGIAWSNDRGRTWTKWEGNPALPNAGRHRDFRDPSVFWHEESGRWVMALSSFDHVQFWTSPDLKKWEYRSSFGREWGAHGGTWECPNLFPMQVSGSDEVRWVLILNLNPGGPQGGSGTQYFVGDFDGRSFTLDPSFAAALRDEKAIWLDAGRDNYAGITWSDVPKEDGRRIFIGWMSNWDYAQQVPTKPWRSAMTLPRSLRLERTRAGYRVFSEPVRELAALRAESVSLPAMVVDGRIDVGDRLPFPVMTSEVVLEFRRAPGAPGSFGIELANSRGETYRVGFDARRGEYFSDRRNAGDHSFSDKFGHGIHRARRLADGDTVRMRLVLDVASAELFADDGATVMTDIFFPTEVFDRIAVFSEDGAAVQVRGEVHRLNAIW
jgi:fructan beta-fructosidase